MSIELILQVKYFLYIWSPKSKLLHHLRNSYVLLISFHVNLRSFHLLRSCSIMYPLFYLSNKSKIETFLSN